MNYSDAERLSSVLEGLGYERTAQEEDADLIVTVACSVRQTAIDRIYGKAKKWAKFKRKKPNLKLLLTGCVQEHDRKKMNQVFDHIFEIKDLGEVPKMLGGEAAVGDFSKDYFGIIPTYGSSFRAYVPISTGCNNFCSYCAVPYTRGREKSRPQEEVVAEVKGLVEKGYKEITLLGQNVNSYRQTEEGVTNSSPFINLLKELDKILGDHRIYFYSNHPKDMSEDLIELMPKLEHFPPYIHLPLQSGSNEIIKRMNRHYTKEKYLGLVKNIKEAMPQGAITTDIIVGFPGETDSQFQETVEVMRAAEFDMAFTAQYSPREGTSSAKFKDSVLKAKKVKREKELIDILRESSYAINKKFVGQTLKVLVDGKKAESHYGRTETYKVVEIGSKKPLKIGEFQAVKIVEAQPWKLIGVV